ncbi:MAG TPA: TonB family protein [Verrucomicrobiae bacterium]|nr:TonB family protein [Verrucomicrobiae bacterium]
MNYRNRAAWKCSFFIAVMIWPTWLYSQTSPDPVLCLPGQSQTRVSNPEILTDTNGMDLHPYVNDQVLPLLRANWYTALKRSGEQVSGDATVLFTISKLGGITTTKLVDGSGHAALGELATQAVTNSAPFQPFPEEFSGNFLDLRVRFEFAPAPDWVPKNGKMEPICAQVAGANNVPNCLTPPKPTFSPEPEFTIEARRNGTQGTLLLYVLVGADGTVQHACAARPLGDGLDEKAVEAVRRWKFEPATLHGVPQPVHIAIEVEFHLFAKPEPGTDAANMTVGTSGAASPVTGRIVTTSPQEDTTSGAQEQPTCNSQTNSGCISPPRIVQPQNVPNELYDTKYSGTVTLSLVVGVDGKPHDIKVVKSVAPELDQKAIETVSAWKFEPGMKGGKAVATLIEIQVEFHLYKNSN